MAISLNLESRDVQTLSDMREQLGTASTTELVGLILETPQEAKPRPNETLLLDLDAAGESRLREQMALKSIDDPSVFVTSLIEAFREERRTAKLKALGERMWPNGEPDSEDYT